MVGQHLRSQATRMGKERANISQRLLAGGGIGMSVCYTFRTKVGLTTRHGSASRPVASNLTTP